MTNTPAPAFIRTYVPIAVGWLASWLLSLGVEVDSETQFAMVNGLGAVFSIIYYTVIRLLEAKYPFLGLLLGSDKQPVYVDPKKTVAEQVEEVDAAVILAAKTPIH